MIDLKAMRKRVSKRSTDDAAVPGALLGWLRQHQDEMATLLGELVAVPTENPPGTKLRVCAELL